MSIGVIVAFCGRTMCEWACSVSHNTRPITLACVTNEIALVVGLRLTASGSATATGVDVSSNGGCFFEKKASPRFENNDDQTEVSVSSSIVPEISATGSLLDFRSKFVNTRLPINNSPGRQKPRCLLNRERQPKCRLEPLISLPDSLVASGDFLPDHGRCSKPWQQA